MKPTPDDPRLSALVLGELSSEEAAEIERAAAADPAIRMSLSELEKTTAMLGQVFAPEGAEEVLRPSQREAVLRASRDADALGKVIELESAERSWRPWLAGIGAAAAVACAALLMSRVEPEKGGRVVEGLDGVTEEIALLPLPGPSMGVGSTNVGANGTSDPELARRLDSQPGEYLEKVAKHIERQPLPESASLPPTGLLGGFSSTEGTRVPVLIGTSSYRWVSGWIREKGALPPKDAVRIEELVNVASLPKGSNHGALEISMERSECPWNRDHDLIGFQVIARGGDAEDLRIEARHFGEHRILGTFVVRDDGALPTTLPNGRRTLVLIELRRQGGAPAGERPFFQIDQGGQEPLSLSIPEGRAASSSAGMDHAATLAGFGIWLRSEGVTRSQIGEMLAGAHEDADPVRQDQRRMMGEALKLRAPER